MSISGSCTMATASDSRWRMPNGRLGGELIEVGVESETPNKLGNARSRLLARQVKKAGVKLEILAGRQLRVERKRLRHIADALAGIEIGRVDPACRGGRLRLPLQAKAR